MNAQKDAEGEFYRQYNQMGSCGTVHTITAGGKVIDGKNWEEKLAEFKKLPKEERMPVVGELKKPGSQRASELPAEGRAAHQAGEPGPGTR